MMGTSGTTSSNIPKRAPISMKTKDIASSRRYLRAPNRCTIRAMASLRIPLRSKTAKDAPTAKYEDKDRNECDCIRSPEYLHGCREPTPDRIVGPFDNPIGLGIDDLPPVQLSPNVGSRGDGAGQDPGYDHQEQ